MQCNVRRVQPQLCVNSMMLSIFENNGFLCSTISGCHGHHALRAQIVHRHFVREVIGDEQGESPYIACTALSSCSERNRLE